MAVVDQILFDQDVEMFKIKRISDGAILPQRLYKSQLVPIPITTNKFKKYGKLKALISQRISKNSNMIEVLFKKKSTEEAVWLPIESFFFDKK